MLVIWTGPQAWAVGGEETVSLGTGMNMLARMQMTEKQCNTRGAKGEFKCGHMVCRPQKFNVSIKAAVTYKIKAKLHLTVSIFFYI